MFGARAMPVLWLLAGGAGLMPSTGRRSPSASVLAFHRALVSGGLEEIGNYFSFSSAYQYWQDITASLGIACPDEEIFRRTVLDVFAGARVREELSSYAPAESRHRIVGAVASVVFRKAGSRADGGVAVATTVLEDGRWKVRTYPGVFPGDLLALVRQGAG